jgi:nitrogen fixation protein NifU and related proteins
MMDDDSTYPEGLILMAQEPKYFGRMNAPTSSAYIKGPCGDEMEFYLEISDEIIRDLKFYTEGCIATRVCGSMTAKLAVGKDIEEALAISPKNVMDLLEGLPEDHRHCSILAVSTLYKSIADYLLKP